MLTPRLLRRVTQPGGNGLIDKDRGRGDPVMQVVTRDDGAIGVILKAQNPPDAPQ